MVGFDILERSYHPKSQKNSILRRDNMSKALNSERARSVPRTEKKKKKKVNFLRDQWARTATQYQPGEVNEYGLGDHIE